MTFEDKKEIAWAAAYGSAFVLRLGVAVKAVPHSLDTLEQKSDAVLGDRTKYEKIQSYARKVADAAVKDLMPGWKP